MQLDAAAAGGGLDGIDGVADEGGEVDGAEVEAELAGGDACAVEEVFDEFLLRPGRRG